MLNETTEKLQAAIPGLTLAANLIGAVSAEQDADGWAHDLWSLLLSRNGKFATFEYKTGIGHRVAGYRVKTPQLADLLYSLVLDASAESESFEDWAANLGYDSVSRKALAIYLTCQENAKKLRQLLTREEFETAREILRDY